MREDERNKLHSACFGSDRLKPQRCCTPTAPIEVSMAKRYPTCLASSGFQGLDFYFREICADNASFNSTESKKAWFKPRGLNKRCFSVPQCKQNNNDNFCEML